MIALHGWIILDKPVGIGSTPCVAAVKRALRLGGYGKVKVGHGGTLDPLASGVLPIALGEATKLAGRMLDADKAYLFTIGFGVETDTLDREGRAVARSPVLPTLARVEAVLPRFIGAIDQVPPAFSAIKVDGERAYDRARAGEAVTMATRAVTIFSLLPHPAPSPEGERPTRQSPSPTKEASPNLSLFPSEEAPLNSNPSPSGEASLNLSPSPPREASLNLSPSPSGEGLGVGEPGTPLISLTLLAHVSKGTYIRSLARDIAVACGTVGHVTMLRRLKAGPFGLAQAISLDKLADLATARSLEQSLLPLMAGLDDIPALPVTPDQAGALRQGRKLIGIAASPGLHLAIEGHTPVALVEFIGPDLRVVRGFNL